MQGKPIPVKPTQQSFSVTAGEVISYFKSQIEPTVTPKPSWYDIYRYATDESEWYEKERVRLVASNAKLDDIEQAARQSNFFDEIKGIADIQMMNACLQIAKANGIENPLVADYGTT